MPLVEITGLQPRNDMLCRAPLVKKERGRPQVARLTAGEQRARVAAFNGALQNIPDRLQRCVVELGLQTFKCGGSLCRSG